MTSKLANAAASLTLAICLLTVPPTQPASADQLTDEVNSYIASSDNSGLESLLASNPSIPLDTLNGEGAAPLHVASSVGNLKAAELLITHGANIDVRESQFGWTPVMVAAYNGHEDLVRYLIAQDADTEVVGKDKSTVLSLARFSGLSGLVVKSKKPKKELSRRENSLLLIKAVEAGDTQLTSGLLKKGANPYFVNKAGWSAMHYAAARLDGAKFRRLSDAARHSGYRLPKYRFTFLHAALIGGKTGINAGETKLIAFLGELEKLGFDLNEESKGRNAYDIALGLGYGDRVLSVFQDPPVDPIPFDIKLKRQMTVAEWKEVQRKLKSLGLYAGAIDGVAGSGTRKAVYAYFRGYLDTAFERAKKACKLGRDAKENDRFYTITSTGVTQGIRRTSSGYYDHGYYCYEKDGLPIYGMEIRGKSRFEIKYNIPNDKGWYDYEFIVWQDDDLIGMNTSAFHLQYFTLGKLKNKFVAFGPDYTNKDLSYWGIMN